MAQLKAVFFSIRNVFFDEKVRSFDEQKIEQLIKLIRHLAKQNIKVILHSNDRWEMTHLGNITIAQHLSNIVGEPIQYYNKRDYPALPSKPKRDSINYILQNENLEPNETIYVGCNINDWRASINSKILFIKANWLIGNEEIPYGFSFDDIPALARFIDICCIKANITDLITYKDDGFEYHTLSPFSTYKPEFQAYSASARSTAKKLTQDAEPDFWLMLLISKIYFSGLYNEIQAIIAFPGHKQGFGNAVMDEALDVFAKCFRLSYLHNALIRHTESIKSQHARIQGNANALGIYNHLNTLYLNPYPIKYGANKALTTNPYRNKTILLIDDIATSGYSFDAAKLLLERAGCRRVICFSWLKTINKSLNISRERLPQHYDIHIPLTNVEQIYTSPLTTEIPYNSIIPSSHIGNEMTRLFADFINWQEDI
ncbi:HAD hydrolase-like protein [Acinetobacter nosocomialis]|uniref:HAD hydrolase-like protein n=1 Tax=Acinetobacter nosocomialis TaxID=106654 RepID=UPI0021CEA4E8|nr:HAD hydrolase-like protein [Acinetobacter nosocomialis]MCU4552458.1 HAD hydrolase-like protein [Acinetobacter nosocomialis]